MPVRERPYVQFNFRVTINTVAPDPGSIIAGFQEVTNIATELTVAEYRNGNDLNNNTRKIVGLNKSPDITFKRGVIGAKNLYQWVDDQRNGKQRNDTSIQVELLSEDRESVVQVWRLANPRIIKYSCGPLNAKGTDVALEEMTVTYERLTVEFPQDS